MKHPSAWCASCRVVAEKAAAAVGAASSSSSSKGLDHSQVALAAGHVGMVSALMMQQVLLKQQMPVLVALHRPTMLHSWPPA